MAAVVLWLLLFVGVLALVVIAMCLCSLVGGTDKQLEILIHQLTAEQRIKQVTDRTLRDMHEAAKEVQR